MARKSAAELNALAEKDADESAEATTKGADLSEITQVAERMVEMDAKIQELKDEGKALAEERRTLATVTLPEMMKSVGDHGLTEFLLNSGHGVKIKPLVDASIPSKSAIEKEKDPVKKSEMMDRQKKCFQALRNRKAGDLIKSTLVISAGRGTTAQVKAVLKVIKAEKLAWKRDQMVAPATLVKWIKERLEKGLEVDTDTFKIFNGLEAKITKPKKK